MKPKLTEEASAVIAEEYSKLRSEDMVESDVARVSRRKTLDSHNKVYKYIAHMSHFFFRIIFRLNR